VAAHRNEALDLWCALMGSLISTGQAPG